ncbi:MAG: C25 family cysteine peptidase, partial [Flavobacteriales bacterium]
MRRTLLVVVLVILSAGAFAQTYGNEWIAYDQQYWTFKIWQNGIRTIDSTSLADSGFPIADVDPRTIRMYARGRQVPIHIAGEEDGVFNSSDHIEFYGAKNDGWLDSTLWDNPAHINDPFYSLYNDTIRYFLTWKTGPGAEREIVNGSGNWAANTAQPWCWTTTLITYPLYYQTGKRTVLGASDCMINEAEGYFRNTSLNATGADVTQTQTLTIPSIYQQPGAPDATYKLVVASANNSGGANTACMDHHVQLVRAGNVLVDTVFHGYQLNKFTLELANSSLSQPSTALDFKVVHDQTCTDLPPDYPDAHVLSWQSIRYPRDLAFAASTTVDVEVPGQPSGDSTLISFTFTGTPVLYAWAANGLHRVDCVNSTSTTWQAVLPPSTGDMRLFISRPTSVTPAGPLGPENGNGYFVDPSLNLPDSALVIVTHPSLMAAAQQYAQYRESNPFNHYNTIVADVDQLYDEFGGGVWHHPLAIRRFLKYVYDHAATRPQALFLIGKSVKAPQTGGLDYNRGYRADPLATASCLVPTIGWPSSDILYGLNLSGTNPNSLDVPVGRLAAKNPTEVLDYLAKMDSDESQPPAAWMKNILHFRGGFTAQEWQQFDAALNSYQVIAEDTSFSGHVTKFVKNGGGIIEQAAADSVHDLIAKGVTLMTFFAHAYGGGFDITIDVPTNYEWHGKF